MKHKKVDEIKVLKQTAKAASDKATRTSRALGLTITAIVDNAIIEKHPNGKISIAKTLDDVALPEAKKLKKGNVLWPK